MSSFKGWLVAQLIRHYDNRFYAFCLKFLLCLLVWDSPGPIGDPKRAKVIVTQAGSELRQKKGEPRKSSGTNLSIAGHAAAFSKDLVIPVIAQQEVFDVAWWFLSSRNITACPDTVNSSSILNAKYIDSLTVAQEQYKLCRERGISNVLMLAFHVHGLRAWLSYIKVFGPKNVVVPRILPECVYGENLVQLRWEHPLKAHAYELVARLGSLVLGRI